MTQSKTDVLIVGGGPAGSTVATLLRKNGWHVTVIEKDVHPRFHIGESLLPMNMPILDRLGVLERVRHIGVPKLGADFTIGNSGDNEQTFLFSKALGASPTQAFEVRRAEFDQLLLDRSREIGAAVLEGTRVIKATPRNDGSHDVAAVDENGKTRKWNAKFLIDASGRDTFLSSANGWKTRNPRHASAAVFAHFRGVARRPGDNQGNISVYWFQRGWVWMIPLRDDIMSVGAVCQPSYLKARSSSLDDFLAHTLDSIEETRERMVGATRELPAQATGNYSYLSTRMSGPGYLMIGDAYAFIDPVFSSGVYLAMSSAERAVSVAEAWLSGSRRQYRLAVRQFEKQTNRGISTFSWFIYRFTSPAMSNLMRDPRDIFGVVGAVISMLAGDVFGNFRIGWRLSVFKLIFGISWVVNWKASIEHRRLITAEAGTPGERDE
jgi:flavin-dependent dehydrogenase